MTFQSCFGALERRGREPGAIQAEKVRNGWAKIPSSVKDIPLYQWRENSYTPLIILPLNLWMPAVRQSFSLGGEGGNLSYVQVT